MEKKVLEKLNSLEKKLFSHIKYINMNNSISPLDEGIEQTPLISLDSQTVARKHKKQDTTDFKEYKKQNKSNKKDEKAERDKLKVKIAVLANKLFRKNKINKPLYRKLYNISIGAARLPTLQTTYKNLKEFKHTDTVVQKKHFNQSLKQKKENKKVFNTVYIKYEVYEKIEEGQTQEKANVKHHTLEVQGDEEDIRREIKSFIQFVLNMPYVNKVLILRVVINKQDKDANYYRWKGGKKDNSGMEYMKAWGANFKYHGFNVDMNDETPFECIPNALVKMYGNREAGHTKYISPVVKGGINYVKSILDSYADIGSDLDHVDNTLKPKGYTPHDILCFCNKFRIRCFGYDYKMEKFMTNHDYDIPWNKNLPAFVFYFNDEHIYLITDKQMRHSLLNNTSNKADLISLLSKKKWKIIKHLKM